MSIHNFATANLAGASGASSFYNGATSRSLRFDGASYASKTLSHTPSGTKGTWSLWYKPAPNDGTGWSLPHSINSRGFSGGGGSQAEASLYLNSGRPEMYQQDSNAYTWRVQADGYWKDSSAWTHFVARMDTTQSTASDRIRFYINGVQLTNFATASYPNQNLSTRWANTNNRIGVNDASGNPYANTYFHGQIADFHYTDGYSYAADSFGEFKNGAWIPLKDPSVTYGDAGWRFQFLQTGTNADASGIFADTKSGNSNFQHHAL